MMLLVRVPCDLGGHGWEVTLAMLGKTPSSCKQEQAEPAFCSSSGELAAGSSKDESLTGAATGSPAQEPQGTQLQSLMVGSECL